jgi:hypothetical protein
VVDDRSLRVSTLPGLNDNSVLQPFSPWMRAYNKENHGRRPRRTAVDNASF